MKTVKTKTIIRNTAISALAALMAAGMLAGCAKGFDKASNITVITREDGSGTKGAFDELFGLEVKNSDGTKSNLTMAGALTNNSTGVVMTTVASDINAIGYISLGSLNDTVKALKIDGAEATVENIKNGSYGVSRPFNIATKDNLSDLGKDFIAFILSSDGQAVIESKGYIRASANGAYDGAKPSGTLKISGSSSVTPVMEKLKEAYLKINTNAAIEINQTDSTSGMTAAADGTSDIGMASRDVKDSELEKGLTATKIAIDGIAVIVNKENPLESLTKSAVKSIYTGEAKVWEAIDGAVFKSE